MDEQKQPPDYPADSAIGCLSLLLISVVSIGGAVAAIYAVQWLIGF